MKTSHISKHIKAKTHHEMQEDGTQMQAAETAFIMASNGPQSKVQNQQRPHSELSELEHRVTHLRLHTHTHNEVKTPGNKRQLKLMRK